MAAISRLYKSAKSLLLLHSEDQDSMEIHNTPILPEKCIQKSTITQRVDTSVDLEDKNAEDNPQQTYLTGSNKKRARFNHQYQNETIVGSSLKKHKSLPLREKASAILQTPEPRPITGKIEKNKNCNSEPQDLVTSIENFDHNKERGSDSYDPKTHKSIIRTPMNQVRSGNLDPTPFFTAQHYRFGSEEIVDKNITFSTLQNKGENIVSPESDDESRNDEPEEISVQQSKQAFELKIKNVAKAVAGQKPKTQKKKKLREKLKKKQFNSHEDRIKDVKSAPEKTRNSNTEFQKNTSSNKLPLTSKHSLPDLLPLEYLEDDEDKDTSQISSNYSKKLCPTNTVEKKKKIKLSQQIEKEIKDRRIGSTTFRVVKACNNQRLLLAPKASFHARSVKEMWLQQAQRNGLNRGSNKRLPFSNAFK